MIATLAMGTVIKVDFKNACNFSDREDVFSRLVELSKDSNGLEMPDAYRSQLVRAFTNGSETKFARTLVNVFDNPRPILAKMRREGVKPEDEYRGFTDLLMAAYCDPERFLGVSCPN